MAKRVRRAVPVVAVPFMGDVGRRLCEQEGVGWLDLSGNARIIAPGLRVIIEGKPNRFKTAGRPANLFAPKSSRIVRWLLIHASEHWAGIVLCLLLFKLVLTIRSCNDDDERFKPDPAVLRDESRQGLAYSFKLQTSPYEYTWNSARCARWRNQRHPDVTNIAQTKQGKRSAPTRLVFTSRRKYDLTRRPIFAHLLLVRRC